MNSLNNGKNISACSISNINEHGLWLIINDKEYFVPFNLYPEFKEVPLNKIFSVKLLSPTQLHWDDLDVDIEVTALEKPDQFPLYFSKK